MILIAYDGSDDAKAAITEAAKLFPGEDAIVLMVWQRFIDTLARSGTAVGMMIDYDAVDEAAGANAGEKAGEGTRLAQEAGLKAISRTAVAESTTASTVIAQAAEVDAKAIVMGTRGLSRVKSLFLGSTSNAVLQHSDRPVLVVPSPAVVAERAKHLSES